jgi:branched-chain amino acid transport system permease protein
MHRPLLAAGTWRRVLPAYGMALLPVALLLLGAVMLIETSHHLLVKASEGPAMGLLGVAYQANSPAAWISIVLLLLAGGLALRRMAPKVSDAFHGARQEAMSRLSTP